MHARPALRLHCERGLETQNLTAPHLTPSVPTSPARCWLRGNKNAICISLLICQTPSYCSAPPQALPGTGTPPYNGSSHVIDQQEEVMKMYQTHTHTQCDTKMI